MLSKNKNLVNTLSIFDKEKKEWEDDKEVDILVKIEKRHFKKGEFFMQAKSLDDLIIENNLNSVEIKTLISLRRRIDYNNRIKTFNQQIIAEEIHSTQANISRAIKKLQAEHIIYKQDLNWFFNDKYIKFAGDNKK